MKTKTKLGYVAWFDNSSGEGEIRCPADKTTYYVHWSAITHGVMGAKTLEKNQPVRFTIYENLYSKQVDTVERLHFDWSTEHEKDLVQLMNDAFEDGSVYIFDLADLYFKES